MLLSKHRRYAALRMGGFRAYNGNAAWAVFGPFPVRLLRRHLVAKLGVDFLWHGELALLNYCAHTSGAQEIAKRREAHKDPTTKYPLRVCLARVRERAVGYGVTRLARLAQ